MIEIEPFGNCFYCNISYYLYNNQNSHLELREEAFQYINDNRNLFCNWFEDHEDNTDNLTIDEMLDNYIFEYNREGEYAGELKFEHFLNYINWE